MTTARDAWMRFDAATRRRMTFTTILALALGFGVLIAYWWGYERLVQHPACYAYAQQRGAGDERTLRVTGVGVSWGFRGEHRCTFVERGSGRPVSLRFAPRDVPRGRDFAQWTSMVAVTALVMGMVMRRGETHVVDPRYHRSAKAALARRRRTR